MSAPPPNDTKRQNTRSPKPKAHSATSVITDDVIAAEEAQQMKEQKLVSAEALAEIYKGSSVIDPRRSRFMPVWDVVMLVALFFTATVTPFEVTFIDEGAWCACVHASVACVLEIECARPPPSRRLTPPVCVCARAVSRLSSS